MNVNLLALETSSSRCGVALLRESEAGCSVSVLEHEGSQEHAERLLPMAQQLLADAGLSPADLHTIAFGQGPGGFTGLRVACGAAQGMGFGLGVPVIPVVSHLAVAQETAAEVGDTVIVALDARMNEVYLAVYARASGTDPTWQIVQSPILIAADEVVPWAMHHLPIALGNTERERQSKTMADAHDDERLGDIVADRAALLAGDAWDVYAAQMIIPQGWRRTAVARPQAHAVAQLARQAWLRGEAIAPELASPLYVRDKVAFTTAERANGLGGNPKAIPTLSAVVLEPMAEADVDAVAELEFDLQAFPWTRANFADALASGYESCVLRQSDKVVGFCCVMLAPDVAHLLVVGVSRAHQRLGLGGKLLTWCEDVSRKHALPAVMLEVRPSNESALAFYEKIGFQQIGVRRGYYAANDGLREDALILQKTLTNDGTSQ